MKRFLDWLAADTVYFRTCMFLAGGSIIGVLAWMLSGDRPEEWWVWLVIGGFGLFGLALVLIPLLASDQRFERSLDLMADGGDIPVLAFFVLVAFVAIPITALIRYLKRHGA
ncbi:hypothetical protein FACS1894116_11470 [Betaproteobacteria bacterium]|nr:hypothetical protein FACS1894116_11470 [Betaproteobacteria bacterium]